MKTTDQSLVEEYRYNGLGQRIGWHFDVDGDGTVESGADDPWFYAVHDDRWRIVATIRGTDTYDPDGGGPLPLTHAYKEEFVYHAAGLGGTGGSSYIDAVVLRNRDAGTNGAGWDDAGDGVLEERRVYCQNWRGDVVALLTESGKLVEQVRYTPYGVPTALPSGDTDSDGDWDATDSAAIGGAYDVREDTDLDFDNDSADVTHANSISGGYQTLGRLMLSSTSVRSRKGYASYEHDAAGALDHVLAHVRYRVLRLDLGRWIQRDPAGYVDGVNLYQYAGSKPVVMTDPMGMYHAPPCTTSCAEPSPSNQAPAFHSTSAGDAAFFLCSCNTPWTATSKKMFTCRDCELIPDLGTGQCWAECTQQCEETCTGTMDIIIWPGYGWPTILTIACQKSRFVDCIPLNKVKVPGKKIPGTQHGSGICEFPPPGISVETCRKHF